MSVEIVLVLAILGVAVLFLIFEWVPMEVVALLTLGIVAITGLVSPKEALSGFSSPAVVTIWAVFIISGGLTRTGVANILGRVLIRFGGHHEAFMIATLMLSAGVLSAFMNNVAVAALMLPVVMDISRQTTHSAPRLLMPLAYGSLLGGLTTLIGTPPNLLVANALRDFGLKPFGFFDFTPIGLCVFFSGTAFMALIGRHLLPSRDMTAESSAPGHTDLRDTYELRQRLFLLRLPTSSPLVGKKLSESRLGSILGLHVIGILRAGTTQLAPDPSAVLQAGDRLLVEGRVDRMEEIRNLGQLILHEKSPSIEVLRSKETDVREMKLTSGSPYIGRTIGDIGFRHFYQLNVLAVQRNDQIIHTNLRDLGLQADDVLLVHGTLSKIESLATNGDFETTDEFTIHNLDEKYHLNKLLFETRVPAGSVLVNKTIAETRFGDALDMRVLCITRRNVTFLPGPEERLQPEDRLLLGGNLDTYIILRELEELEVDQENLPKESALESARVGMVEAVLSPRTALAGKSLRQISFRAKYGLSVLAILHEGKVTRSNLRDIPLHFGDALLLYGPRERLKMLGQEPDFIVLTQEAQEAPRKEKAAISILIMALVVAPVILGWVPIYISAVIGACLMVITGCLKMDEAYRFIEWKAVFVIAGMLPLGMAIEKTGAAKLLAEGVVAMVGPFGPTAILAGLIVLTFTATCFIPTAALVVLMAPIAFSTATSMGLTPYPFLMGVAMAASSSFMTPVSHPANLLVMGPGGYRFLDYLKVGSALTFVVLAVLVGLMPFMWPF